MSETLTRDELHDLVWSVPVSRLARRFGISDVGLAKICARHEIPRPPRGYWAKVQAGKRLGRTPLPPLSLSERKLRTITISPTRCATPLKERAQREAQDPDSGTSQDPPEEPLVSAGAIVVADKLESPHDLLRPAKRRGKSKKRPGKTLRMTLRESYCRKCYGRMLRSLDALLKYLEAEVYLVEVNAWKTPPQFVATIEGLKIIFEIREETKSVRRKKRIPPDERRSWQDPYEIQTIEQCTGRLVFETSGGWHYGSFEWKETEKKRIQDHLHECVSGMVRVAAAKREAVRREEEARGRREKEEEERRRREAEQRRLQELEALADNWAKAERLRAFVATARKRARDRSKNGDEPWMADALAHADRIDPLQKSNAGAFTEGTERV